MALSARQPEPGTNHSGYKGAICSTVFWYGGRVCSVTPGTELVPALCPRRLPPLRFRGIWIRATVEVGKRCDPGFVNRGGIKVATM